MGWVLVAGPVVLVVVLTAVALLRQRSHPEVAALPAPEHRPIEVVVRDARRLGRQFHAGPAGTTFTKRDAVRWAYDAVLGEVCSALDLPHLLGVLAPGDELDAERRRVELLLLTWGLDLDDAA